MVWGWVWLDRGRVKKLWRLTKALFHFRELKQTFDIGKTLYEIGMLFADQRALGDQVAAKENFEEALQIFEGLGADPSAEMVRGNLAELPI